MNILTVALSFSFLLAVCELYICSFSLYLFFISVPLHVFFFCFFFLYYPTWEPTTLARYKSIQEILDTIYIWWSSSRKIKPFIILLLPFYRKIKVYVTHYSWIVLKSVAIWSVFFKKGVVVPYIVGSMKNLNKEIFHNRKLSMTNIMAPRSTFDLTATNSLLSWWGKHCSRS